MTRVDVYYALASVFLLSAEITLFYAPAPWVPWALISLGLVGGIFTALGRRASKKQRAEYEAAKKADAEKARAELESCQHMNTRSQVTLSEICTDCGVYIHTRIEPRKTCKHLNVHHEGSLGLFCDECGAPV